MLQKSGCRIWKGAKNPDGYGRFYYESKPQLAHRVVFSLANNIHLKDVNVVRHSCDNPACCEPTHLLNGTHKDNMLDRVVRRTRRRGNTIRRFCKRGHEMTPENTHVWLGVHRCKTCIMMKDKKEDLRTGKYR